MAVYIGFFLKNETLTILSKIMFEN
jgi:hypothetical protein